MPLAGRHAWPSRNLRKTKQKSFDDCSESGARKIPKRNGRKKSLIIIGDRRSCSRKNTSVVTSGLSGKTPESRRTAKLASFNLSAAVPNGAARSARGGPRKGSITMHRFSPFCRMAPGVKRYRSRAS
eukprot:6174898-Pleurochrysis_carterae.AAC.3